MSHWFWYICLICIIWLCVINRHWTHQPCGHSLYTT